MKSVSRSKMFVWFALAAFAIGACNIYQYNSTLRKCLIVRGVPVEMRRTPPSHSPYSRDYHVFRYIADEVEYVEEYRSPATDGSKIAKTADDPDTLKQTIKKPAA